MSMLMLMLCREKLAPRTGHVREGGMSLSSSLTGSVPRMTQAGSAVIHTPDRSRLPFGSRGALAARSTSPDAVRGARGVGNPNHWAPSAPGAPTRTVTIRTASARLETLHQARLSLFICSAPLILSHEEQAWEHADSDWETGDAQEGRDSVTGGSRCFR